MPPSLTRSIVPGARSEEVQRGTPLRRASCRIYHATATHMAKAAANACSRMPNLLGPSPFAGQRAPAQGPRPVAMRRPPDLRWEACALTKSCGCWTSLVQNQGPIAMTNKWLQRQGCYGDAWVPTPSLMAGHSGGSVRPDSMVSRSKGCHKRGKKLLSTPCATHGVRGNGNSSHQAQMPRSSLPTCAGALLSRGTKLCPNCCAAVTLSPGVTGFFARTITSRKRATSRLRRAPFVAGTLRHEREHAAGLRSNPRMSAADVLAVTLAWPETAMPQDVAAKLQPPPRSRR